MDTISQNKKIKDHLMKGGKLTPLDALYQFHCWSLSSRISDLKKEGLKIKTDMIEITSDGKKKRVARYSIMK
jgi:hypothetical protein